MRSKYPLFIVGLLVNLFSYSLLTMAQVNHRALAQSSQPTSPLAAPPTAPATTAGVLPDALYFLNADGQIARLEADGIQATVITHEREPITAFAVAPDGTHLAYITGNSLIESDAQGNLRRVKVKGAAIDPTDYRQQITQQISGVIYTPDGQGITFGLNGINQIASGAAESAVQTLLPNDPYPAPQQPAAPDGTHFVWPVAWSPTGDQLLARSYTYDTDLFAFRVWVATTGLLPGLCADTHAPVTWSRDGQALLCVQRFYWSDLLNQLYIRRVDPVTGAATVLIGNGPPNTPAAPITNGVYRAIFETIDGDYLLFSDQQSKRRPATADLFFAVQQYTMQRLTADGAQVTPLRTDAYHLAGDLLWAEDGSGAVISHVTQHRDEPQVAPLLWLPSDGSPAVPLFAVGRQMQWRTSRHEQRTVAQPARAIAPTPASVTATATVTTAVPAILAETVSMYSTPGVDAAISGRLQVGTPVALTGRTEGADAFWWQIAYPPDSAGRAWLSGATHFADKVTPAQVPVVADVAAASVTAVTQLPLAELSRIYLAPDGAYFATIADQMSQGGEWTVKVWQTADGAHVRDFTQAAFAVRGVALSPAGQWLATVADGADKAGIKIWRIADGALVATLSVDDLPAGLKSVAFAPDGATLAVGGKLANALDGTLWLFDTKSWTLRQRLPMPGQEPTVVAFSPDSRLLVSAGVVRRFHAGAATSSVRLWQVSDGQLLHEWRGGAALVFAIAFAPDNQSLAYGFCDEAIPAFVALCAQGGVAVVQVDDGATLHTFDQAATGVAFSPDGQWLALGAAFDDNTVRLYHTANWSSAGRLPIAAQTVNFSADGNYLVTSDYQRATIWSFNTEAIRRQP